VTKDKLLALANAASNWLIIIGLALMAGFALHGLWRLPKSIDRAVDAYVCIEAMKLGAEAEDACYRFTEGYGQ
jgi:hypothetical protein